MLLILAPNVDEGKFWASGKGLVGEYRIVTPNTTDKIRGVNATSLIRLQHVHLPQDKAQVIYQCFYGHSKRIGVFAMRRVRETLGIPK